jgi:hypothetical protein
MNPLIYLLLLLAGTIATGQLLRKALFRKRLPDRNTLSYGIGFLATLILLYFTIGFIRLPGWEPNESEAANPTPGLPPILVLYLTVISTTALFLLIIGIMRGLTRKVSSTYQFAALFIAVLIIMTLYYFFNLMGNM